MSTRHILNLFYKYFIYYWNCSIKNCLPLVMIIYFEISGGFVGVKSEVRKEHILIPDIEGYRYKSSWFIWLFFKTLGGSAVVTAPLLFIFDVYLEFSLNHESFDYGEIVLCFLFSAFVICLSLLHLLFMSYVKVDSKGISYRRFFQERIIAWKDILGVAPTYKSPFGLVVVRGKSFFNRYILFGIGPLFYGIGEKKEPLVIEYIKANT